VCGVYVCVCVWCVCMYVCVYISSGNFIRIVIVAVM